ncbi:hypothetical protein Mgra_00002370 [Meloidogyne graminicola]|uniref:Uncharacterized protein n=1 Tax=Meloidogyne graminicola TaxID=189291 RepID=A0A8S9ZWM5_9BILA|nr:hypothetical protein Mgra_00002370 [Meloidogyne graminicola]
MSIFRRINSLHNQIKISTLAFASLNVFVVGYIGIYFINKINQWRVQKIEHYKEAVAILLEHDEAINLLGKPFRIGLADTFDRRNNYVGKTESKFLIPLFGTNCDASLNVFAQRECDLSKFLLKKLELETAEGDRYLIFERVNEIKNSPEELPKQKRPRLCRE